MYIQARSRNHCYRGKETSIKKSVGVSVPSGTQPAWARVVFYCQP